MPAEEGLDLEAILSEIGDFGPYQIRVFIYLGVTIIFTAAYGVQYVFSAGAVPYRCRVPECESTPAEFHTNGWDKFALPASGFDCRRLVPVGKSCVPASFSNKTTPCTSWVYENRLTIVPEFNLACHEWKRTLVGTVHSAGVFVAIPITAWVSDGFGRRLALVGTAALPAVFGVLRAFCDNYIQYLVLEFLEAVVGAGTYSTAFILALEMLSLKKRVIGGNILSGTFALGQVCVAVVAWAIPYWRTFTLAIFAPSFLFVFFWFFVQESVRWLLSIGRKKEAIRIIMKAAFTNKIQLSQKCLDMMRDKPVAKVDKSVQTHILRGSSTEEQPKRVSLFHQVLKSRIILFRICVCSFWWITVTLIYYGLSINSVSLAGNKYFNFILTSLVEIPGNVLSLLTLNRFGRKSSIMTAFFICGTALLSLPFIENLRVVIALTLLGKMMISMVFCSIYIYTVELFPTQARHSLLGVCSMTGRIGSMSAPQTPLLMKIRKSLPYILFGSMAGASGLLMLLTPETHNLRLPDTIAQAEQMDVAPRTNKKTDILVEKREGKRARPVRIAP